MFLVLSENIGISEMNAKEILRRAIDRDQNGRILEAQELYQDGIEKLMTAVVEETDVAKKKIFYERIKDYIDRAEQIKLRLQTYNTGAKLVANVPIDEDSVGHSYQSLFGSYLNGQVKEVLIEEPHLYERHQMQNLVMFIELLVKKCLTLKFIRVITKTYTKAPNDQINNFKQIQSDLAKRNIALSYKFDDNMHDRKIALSSGYIFKSGRGLHIYKPTEPLYSLGMVDYDFRRCRQTDVDILHAQGFST